MILANKPNLWTVPHTGHEFYFCSKLFKCQKIVSFLWHIAWVMLNSLILILPRSEECCLKTFFLFVATCNIFLNALIYPHKIGVYLQTLVHGDNFSTAVGREPKTWWETSSWRRRRRRLGQLLCAIPWHSQLPWSINQNNCSINLLICLLMKMKHSQNHKAVTIALAAVMILSHLIPCVGCRLCWVVSVGFCWADVQVLS